MKDPSDENDVSPSPFSSPADDSVDENLGENPDDVSNEETQHNVAFSLQDLGRAYAKAVGLTGPSSDEAEPEDAGPDSSDDAAVCPISPQSIVEAILFVGAPEGEKLTSRKIASVLRDVSPKEVTEIAKELNTRYEQEGAAYRIRSDRSNIEMVLAEPFEGVRERFYGEIRSAKLSQGAVDVLAIVAYNQPVSESRVEEIRGRPCGSILRQLVKRELLSIVEPPEKKRAREFRTTDRFLQLFGLESLEDLPQSHEAMTTDLID